MRSFPAAIAARAKDWVARAAILPFSRDVYELASHFDKGGAVTFMNFGYTPSAPAESELALAPEDEANRYSIQLYHHLVSTVGEAALAGRDILEVGCGRGGGADYIARQLSPRSVAGVDRTRGSIKFCRAKYRQANLTFSEGDAQALPFPAQTFDIVFNVESSHCYPSMSAFLAEVHRVLRPGGQFLFADSRRTSKIEALKDAFRAAGFRIAASRDITGNVVAAMDREEARKRALFEKLVPRSRLVPRRVRERAEDWAGMKAGESYRKLASRQKTYLSLTLEKTG